MLFCSPVATSEAATGGVLLEKVFLKISEISQVCFCEIFGIF